MRRPLLYSPARTLPHVISHRAANRNDGGRVGNTVRKRSFQTVTISSNNPAILRRRVNRYVDLVGLDTGDPLVGHNRLAELLSRLEHTLRNGPP